MTAHGDGDLDLEEILTERSVPTRDCRECARYEPGPDGLACGWCTAHEQWVKLYHQPKRFHSQCQFISIRRERPRG